MVRDVLFEPMLALLIAAAVVYLLLGDAGEAAVLGVSVLAVAGLSLYQQEKSESALRALRDLSSPRGRVLRDGSWRSVAARDLVVDDVIALNEGDRVPADARLIEDVAIQVDESMLTGESVPVRRSSATDDAEQSSVQAGTLVVSGHGIARTTATGADTAMGRIGVSLRSLRPEPTPIQREMRRAVVVLFMVGLASCALVVLLYGTTHGDWLAALLAGITLAISNIPEEFPVVLTVFLALGGWRMAQQNALLRRAPAIEALGAVTVLCTDKTGTLTRNRMRLSALGRDGARVAPGVDMPEPMHELLDSALLACARDPVDPLERAVIEAHRATAARPAAGSVHGVREYPLSDQLLAVTRVWRGDDAEALRVACKGAPEAVIALCGLEPDVRDRLLGEARSMASEGLRVLGVASSEFRGSLEELPVSMKGFAFTWQGFIGLADPLREGVTEAVADAQAAGVRVVMLTGDHPETAQAIAGEAGLRRTELVALGSDLDRCDDEELARRVQETSVFARVRPEHKLRLIRALQQRGERVAMTGDGVNDAPSLMAAHVGIAMGERGTDVAREAAAIVLLDDNFVTVVRAIRQGRAIYQNICNAVRYILAVHVPITGLALLPLLLGAPMVLLPLHVVFLELIIDPACSIVFEREPPARDLMRRPPRPVEAHLLDGRMLGSGLGQGLAMFSAVAAIYLLGRAQDLPPQHLGALAFTSLVVGNLGLILLNRSATSILRALSRHNTAFWIVTGAALTLLAVVTRLEGPAAWFGFAPPPWHLTLLAAVIPVAPLLALDAIRRVGRRMRAAGGNDPDHGAPTGAA